MKSSLFLMGFCSILLTGAAQAEMARDRSLSPKFILRSSAGVYKNVASQSGKSAPSVGGINVLFYYFLTPQLAAGIGYKAEFDVVRSTLPFKGFDVSGRWYPFGQGTYFKKEHTENVLEFHERFASYFVGEFSQRSYFLAKDGSVATVGNVASEADVLKGSFAAVNFGLGVDLRMSRHFEWNIEVITTLFALASTDPGVRIRTSFLNTGLSYVW